MIFDSIVLIIFIISFGGVLFILARKIPMLSSLPQNGSTGFRKNKIIVNIEDRIKEVSVFFEKQIFLHKILSWIKIMVLRIETKIDVLLHKIRKKNQQTKK